MPTSVNGMMLAIMYLLFMTVIGGAASTGLEADDPANATVAWDAEERVYTQGSNESVLDITSPERMANDTNTTNTSDEQEEEPAIELDEENVEEMDRALGNIPGLATVENVTVDAYLAVGQSMLDTTLSFAAPIGDRTASWAYENRHWITQDHIRAFNLAAILGPCSIYWYRRIQRGRNRGT